MQVASVDTRLSAQDNLSVDRGVLISECDPLEGERQEKAASFQSVSNLYGVE